MTDHDDIIEAFADGEPVAASALEAALAEAEWRAHLIDILVLRGLAGDATIVRSPAPTRASSRLGGRGLAAIAALLVAGVAAGFFAGRETGGVAESDSPASLTTAPAPTHVIRLERGIDWNERTGGN